MKYLILSGTAKGNVIIYDHRVGRKVPILGKHNKKIVCGAWSLQNKLALGGVDNIVTVSDMFSICIYPLFFQILYACTNIVAYCITI